MKAQLTKKQYKELGDFFISKGWSPSLFVKITKDVELI